MNPKININQVIREMTDEEYAEWQQMIANAPEPQPTPEERIAELTARADEYEAALLELAEMAAEREAQAEEQEEALIELAALTEGGE